MLIAEAEALALNPWNFGLAAAVITSLFTALKFTFDFATKKMDEQSKEFTGTIKSMATDLAQIHKSERDEWRASSEKREERIVELCDEMIRTIHDVKNDPSRPS